MFDCIWASRSFSAKDAAARDVSVLGVAVAAGVDGLVGDVGLVELIGSKDVSIGVGGGLFFVGEAIAEDGAGVWRCPEMTLCRQRMSPLADA